MLDNNITPHIYPRLLAKELLDDLKLKSILLLGPRQTGKSTLLKTLFPGALYLNLHQADTLRELSSRPERMREWITSNPENFQVVILDEIQKLPELCDEVQTIIDRDPNIRFILTGSSARKLKRGKANLLGGRLWTRHLHPLISKEFGHDSISRVLNFGALPHVMNSSDPKRELNEYVGTYLKEEIQAEGLTRSLPQFSRFLDSIAFLNAKQINYTEVGNDSQISPRTVRDHFQILLDTLLGFSLPPFQKTKTRKAVATEKFYLFDIGVANALMKRFETQAKTPQYGDLVEHLVFLELKAFIDYQAIDQSLHYWRSQSKFEVDFILNEKHAIEVKGKENVSASDFKGLHALMEENLMQTYTCVTLEKSRRKTKEGVDLIPLQEFLSLLWAGKFQ